MLSNLFFLSQNEIMPGLYIGNHISSSSKKFLDGKKISLVVNCAINLRNRFPEKYSYSNVPVYDTVQDSYKMKLYLDKAADMIKLYRMNDKNVLVHCFAGVSRSATVVAAYLIKYHNLSVDQAIEYIVSKRPQAFHGGKNVVFREILDEFREKHSKPSSFSCEE